MRSPYCHRIRKPAMGELETGNSATLPSVEQDNAGNVVARVPLQGVDNSSAISVEVLAQHRPLYIFRAVSDTRSRTQHRSCCGRPCSWRPRWPAVTFVRSRLICHHGLMLLFIDHCLCVPGAATLSGRRGHRTLKVQPQACAPHGVHGHAARLAEHCTSGFALSLPGGGRMEE